jgi:ribonuclease T2
MNIYLFVYFYNQIANIKPRLMIVWPNLNAGESDFDFWSREWNRHGKCGLDNFQTPFKYFKIALTKTTVMDITQKLADKNIYPDDVRMYTSKEIFDAIEESGYSKPQLECNSLTNPRELREIRFCYTPLSDNVMCPQVSLEIDCEQPFKWPLH